MGNNTTQQAAFYYGVDKILRPFHEYFESHIKVSRFPMIREFSTLYKGIEVVVNVSDEYYAPYGSAVMGMGVEYHWLPMGETGKDMGMNSIFAALNVMYQSYLNDKKVLLHCHAGANRSPTVQACFYYMMTDEHFADNTNKKRDNMLNYNIGRHLPNREYMENWLKKCRHAFDNPNQFIGGMFDWTIDEERTIKSD